MSYMVENMSKTDSNPSKETVGDPLSDLLRKVGFGARIFFSGEYCGRWGVDTSGTRQVPFHLVTSGEGWLHSEGQAPQRLLAGELALFPDDSAHVLSASATPPDPERVNLPPPARMEGPVTRLVCGYFLFNRRVAEPLLASLPATLVLQTTDNDSGAARDLSHLWMREAAAPQLGSDLAIDRLAELVFVHMLRVELAAGRLTGVLGALADPQLGPVIAHIHRSPGSEHSVAALASLSNMSESAFAVRFKREVGLSPGQYVKHWRMQNAAAALADTRDSMAAIAASNGYESEAAFRKAFRAFFGVAPGKWRRQGGAVPGD